MVNKDLYMMKVATYLPVLEPSWSKDPKVLEEHKLNFNPEIGKDIQYEDEDPYFMNRVLRNEFAYAGEESGVPAYVSDMPGYKKPPDFPDIDVNKPDWAFRLTAGGLGLTAAGALAAHIPNKKVSDIGVKAAIGGMGMLGAAVLSKKFPSSDTRKFDAYDKQYHTAINNNDALQKQLDPIQDAYKADFQKRYDQTVTPKVFSNLNTLRIKAMNGDTLADKKYRKELQKFRKSIKPYIRKYKPGYWENQKTAALAEELNPLKTQARTDVNIRKADATDLNAILELFNSLSAEDVKFLAYNTKAALIRQIIRSGKHCYVATDKNKIIGFLRESGRPEGYSLLEELVVHPKYRGKKVASKLLRYFHNSFPKTLAKTNAMNTIMQNILKANGYLPENPNSPRIINWRRGNNLLNTGKEKTAALAEELNPVPKPKRDRSVFQKVVDTLSTNKAKHVAGVAGGISGMLAGRELLHSTMPEIGAIGIVGGAALGAKNIYGLYKDYSD
jgi:GNAT superfamily N-acetyltransferase